MRISTWLTIIGVAVLALVIGLVSGFIPIKTTDKKPTQTEQKIAELTEELAETNQKLNDLSENYVLNTVTEIGGAVVDISEVDVNLNDDQIYTVDYGIYYNRVEEGFGGEELNFEEYEYSGSLDLSEIIIPSDFAEIEENEDDHRLYIVDDYTKVRIRSGLSIKVSAYEVFGEDYENEVIMYLVGINGNDYAYSAVEQWNTKTNGSIPAEVNYEIVINIDNFRISLIYATTNAVYYVHHIELELEQYYGALYYETTLYFDYFSTDSLELTQLQDLDISLDNYGSVENCRLSKMYNASTGVAEPDLDISFLNYDSGTLSVLIYNSSNSTVNLQRFTNADNFPISDTVELIKNYV